MSVKAILWYIQFTEDGWAWNSGLWRPLVSIRLGELGTARCA
jgi:hypothetical protein